MGAHDPGEGCFLPRQTDEMTVTLSTNRGKLHIASPPAPLGKNFRFREFDNDMRRSRWAHRAWTFQERIFSRRIIYYGKTQVFWECREHRESETKFAKDDGFKYRCSRFLDTEDPKLYLNMMFVEAAKRSPDNRKEIDLSNLWNVNESGADLEGIIAMYSQLGLSREKDRLPAIQSLLKHIEDVSGQECREGMWLGSLGRTLFWWPFWWEERNVGEQTMVRDTFRSLDKQGKSSSLLASNTLISILISLFVELAFSKVSSIVLFLDQTGVYVHGATKISLRDANQTRDDCTFAGWSTHGH
jgi:hypothetical protein